VEIDPDTGVVELIRYVGVEDVGAVLNPVFVEGQMQGGVAQGIGQAIGEAIRYDSESGQLLTASFLDYQMPRASDMPDLRFETLAVPTKVNPLGGLKCRRHRTGSGKQSKRRAAHPLPAEGGR
jgi:carbon-monoxide dehydrogenase large subunit